jgi:hypothetical protein
MSDLTSLLAAAALDPARRPEFFRAFLAGEVYALGRPSQPTVGGKAQEGTFMQLVTWSDAEGPLTPIFTSEKLLRRTVDRRPGTDPHFVRMPTRDLLGMLKGQRLVLDPDGDHAKMFTRSEVEALLEGRDPGREQMVVQKDTTILVGAAATIPPALPRVLADFFAKRPVVHQAHLGWIHYPETDQSGYLVVVLADDREAAMQGFGMLQVDEVSGGKTVDVYVIPPNQTKHWLSNVPPFYERPGGLGGKVRSLFGRG